MHSSNACVRHVCIVLVSCMFSLYGVSVYYVGGKLVSVIDQRIINKGIWL